MMKTPQRFAEIVAGMRSCLPADIELHDFGEGMVVAPQPDFSQKTGYLKSFMVGLAAKNHLKETTIATTTFFTFRLDETWEDMKSRFLKEVLRLSPSCCWLALRFYKSMSKGTLHHELDNLPDNVDLGPIYDLLVKGMGCEDEGTGSVTIPLRYLPGTTPFSVIITASD